MNIRTLTEKSREIADLVERRRVDILCLQETRWTGKKSKDLAGGHKLIYNGQTGKNGVAIVLAKDIRETLVQVKRRSERVMSIKMSEGKTTVTVISVYAPQVGCEEAEKDQFWSELEEELNSIPGNEKAIIGGDLNRHVGRDRSGVERWHGGWSVGERNAEGQRILDFTTAQDMALLNTFFEKDENQLSTYRSRGRASQVDILTCRRKDIRDAQDCGVINGEDEAAQHRLVLVKMSIRQERKGGEKGARRIKWWKLKEPEARRQFKERILEEWVEADSAQEWWTANSRVMRKVGEETLGKHQEKGHLRTRKSGGGTRKCRGL